MLDLEALPGMSRAERVQALDAWLGGLLADAVAGTPPPRQRRGGPPPRTGTDGIALIAVGSLGRRELPPHGDLDLVLVHDERPEIAAVADALWYPIWDAGQRLDHSVRSVPEAVSIASTDVKAGLGLLDARLVAGDADLAARLRTATLASWRQSASRLLPALRDLRRGRTRQLGELAFLLEPDLKEAYGGLREGQVLRAAAAAQLADEPSADVEEAYAFLLDVRDELRRRVGQLGRGDRAQDLALAQPAVGLLEVGLEEERQLTDLPDPAAAQVAQLGQQPGRRLPPAGQGGRPQRGREVGVPRHQADVEQSEPGLDVGGGHADGLGHRPHRVVQPQPGVPDRVPDRVGEGGDLRPAVVDEHEVQVTVGWQLPAAQAPDGHQGEPVGAGAGRRAAAAPLRRRGPPDGVGEELPQPGVERRHALLAGHPRQALQVRHVSPSVVEGAAIHHRRRDADGRGGGGSTTPADGGALGGN